MLRKVLRTTVGVPVALLLLLVLAVAVPQFVGGVHSYTVVSDSMDPTISGGDVVFVRAVPADRIESGDVITYRVDDGRPTTHRVVEVRRRDDGRYFLTKGDANEDPDPRLVSSEDVIGRVVFHLPYFGYFLTFAQSRVGIGLFVILPGILLVVSETYDLLRAYRAEGSDEGERSPVTGESSTEEK